MEEIKDGSILIARYIKNTRWDDSLKFYSNDSDFIQVATWNYNKGKHLKAHGHKVHKRMADKTNEVIFIKSGAVKATLFNDGNEIIKELVLSAGDILICYNGGHSYDILEDNTQVLEVKNGPYPGLDKDKKIIEK